jgi:hypothetical protein
VVYFLEDQHLLLLISPGFFFFFLASDPWIVSTLSLNLSGAIGIYTLFHRGPLGYQLAQDRFRNQVDCVRRIIAGGLVFVGSVVAVGFFAFCVLLDLGTSFGTTQLWLNPWNFWHRFRFVQSRTITSQDRYSHCLHPHLRSSKSWERSVLSERSRGLGFRSLSRLSFGIKIAPIGLLVQKLSSFKVDGFFSSGFLSSTTSPPSKL